MLRPVTRYRAAICQPNRPSSRARAISLTMGAEIRNEKVTPSGTPAERKPMNSGTAEQEQKGVTMPSSAARVLPTPRRLPASRARVRSGEKKVWITPIRYTTPASSRKTLGVS